MVRWFRKRGFYIAIAAIVFIWLLATVIAAGVIVAAAFAALISAPFIGTWMWLALLAIVITSFWFLDMLALLA